MRPYANKQDASLIAVALAPRHIFLQAAFNLDIDVSNKLNAYQSRLMILSLSGGGLKDDSPLACPPSPRPRPSPLPAILPLPLPLFGFFSAASPRRMSVIHLMQFLASRTGTAQAVIASQP